MKIENTLIKLPIREIRDIENNVVTKILALNLGYQFDGIRVQRGASNGLMWKSCPTQLSNCITTFAAFVLFMNEVLSMYVIAGVMYMDLRPTFDWSHVDNILPNFYPSNIHIKFSYDGGK